MKTLQLFERGDSVLSSSSMLNKISTQKNSLVVRVNGVHLSYGSGIFRMRQYRVNDHPYHELEFIINDPL